MTLELALWKRDIISIPGIVEFSGLQALISIKNHATTTSAVYQCFEAMLHL